MTNYPTAKQRRALWTVLTFFALVGAGALVIALITVLGKSIRFLQPVLLPFAVAAVLAFLLEPIVRFVCARTRLSRTMTVLSLFAILLLALGATGVFVAPRLYQGGITALHELPEFAQKAQEQLFKLFEASQQRIDKFNLDRIMPAPAATPTPAATPAPPADAPPPVAGNAEAGNSPFDLREYMQSQIPELGKQGPALLQRGMRLVSQAVGGFLGGLGILFNLILIPVYLFFLLVEGREIARRWQDYLPLHDSPLKKEIVSVLTEINGYLVAFFRGQLIVSTIDGVLIGGALWLLVGLKFAFLIGLLVVVLTFIPYLGIVLCYIPAVLIALVQYGDLWHPLMVVAIMFVVQTLEGFLIAPKIVGESTGLHPLTVILSIFAWSLLLEGPIGAILAVPLTASLKVLMRRYVWERALPRARLQPAQEVAATLPQEVGGDKAASAGNQKEPVAASGGMTNDE